MKDLIVVSISRGPSDRNKESEISYAGRKIHVFRIGTDGDMDRFEILVQSYDSTASAIGLGGLDRYLVVGQKRYEIKAARQLAYLAKHAPVVDGFGIKNTLERNLIHWVARKKIVDFTAQKTLVFSAVDRFGMTEEIEKLGGKIVYGDLAFALGINYPMRSKSIFRLIANPIVMNIVSRLGLETLYPGKHQEKRQRWDALITEADILVGDARFLLESLPETKNTLKDKVLLTNTLRPNDIANLRQLGIGPIVTASPDFNGSYLGTNVLDGIFVSLIGKPLNQINPSDYYTLAKAARWEPSLI